MRQIKKFMEAKRPMWNCNECKCVTIQCWKENDAFCGCGESAWPSFSNKTSYTPIYFPYYLGGEYQTYLNKKFMLFWSQQAFVEIDTDPETWDSMVSVWVDGLWLQYEDAVRLQNMFEDLDTGCIEKLFEVEDETTPASWTFTSEAMAQFNARLANPTEEQTEILKSYLEAKCLDEGGSIVNLTNWWPTLPNYKQATSENSVEFFGSFDEWRWIGASIETDVETWDAIVVVGVERTMFASPIFNLPELEDMDHNPTGNCWVEALRMCDTECMKRWIGEFCYDDIEYPCIECDYLPDDVYAAAVALYQNPSVENVSAFTDILQEYCSDETMYGYCPGLY